MNGNNPQGAILWGSRTNYSANGVLTLTSMVISQPGEVEMKITSSSPSSSGQQSKVVVSLFLIHVKEDPEVKAIGGCLFVFRNSQCMAAVPEEVWIKEFPKIRSYSPTDHYLQNLHCEEVLRGTSCHALVINNIIMKLSCHALVITNIIMKLPCHALVITNTM